MNVAPSQCALRSTRYGRVPGSNLNPPLQLNYILPAVATAETEQYEAQSPADEAEKQRV